MSKLLLKAEKQIKVNKNHQRNEKENGRNAELLTFIQWMAKMMLDGNNNNNNNN